MINAFPVVVGLNIIGSTELSSLEFLLDIVMGVLLVLVPVISALEKTCTLAPEN